LKAKGKRQRAKGKREKGRGRIYRGVLSYFCLLTFAFCLLPLVFRLTRRGGASDPALPRRPLLPAHPAPAKKRQPVRLRAFPRAALLGPATPPRSPSRPVDAAAGRAPAWEA